MITENEKKALYFIGWMAALIAVLYLIQKFTA